MTYTWVISYTFKRQSKLTSGFFAEESYNKQNTVALKKNQHVI